MERKVAFFCCDGEWPNIRVVLSLALMQKPRKRLCVNILSQPPPDSLPDNAEALPQSARRLLGLRGLNNLGNTCAAARSRPAYARAGLAVARTAAARRLPALVRGACTAPAAVAGEAGTPFASRCAELSRPVSARTGPEAACAATS